ncbi:polysaccharide deacetylase family protein [Dokdonia sp.]|uniref:polysaccharide deacetylase family protein n=1 Tax=Dokdonia sp. TaxID=2024995 RepID=UPI0032659302
MLNFRSVNIAAVLISIILLAISILLEHFLWAYILLFVIWLFITVAGSFIVKWNYHVSSLNHDMDLKERKIAITFDDGPHPEYTPLVLELLKKYNAKATFFCIGEQVKKHPNIFNQIIKEGHTVGNHTYSHSTNFGFFKTEKVIEELAMTNEIVKETSGKIMQLYRPAFGVTNPRIKKALSVLKLQSIGWNVRSLDTTSRSPDVVLHRITKNLSKGDVVLLHDTSSKTIIILEQLLLFLQKQDIESITVDSLFKIKAYA